jgi:hypothetical protein
MLGNIARNVNPFLCGGELAEADTTVHPYTRLLRRLVVAYRCVHHLPSRCEIVIDILQHGGD